MDQLYTYQILKELQQRSFEDDFGLFVSILVQAVVLYLTVKISIYQSKKEFKRERAFESERRKKELNRIFNVVVRNTLKVAERVNIDEGKFYDSYVEGYNIEKGIKPAEMLVTFPELEMLLAIDNLTFEDAFISDASNEQDIDNLYQLIAGYQSIKVSYDTLSKEIHKINDFISSFDVPVMQEYQNTLEFIYDRLIKFAANESNHYEGLQDDMTRLLDGLNKYESEVNNFDELDRTLKRSEETELFKSIMEDDQIKYYQVRGRFTIMYLKYSQEVSMFHQSVVYLIHRLSVARNNLSLIEKFM